jgi:phage gp29-like protein
MAKSKKSNTKVDTGKLQESQSAAVGWVNQQFAEHPTRGLTPQRLHAILTEAEQGNLQAQSDLFADMEERDAHLFSELSKRKRSLLTVPWGINPPRNASEQEKKQAQEVADWFAEIPDFEDVILDALDGIGHGYSAQEIDWGLNQKIWLPSSLEYIPPRHFQVPTLMSGLSQDEVRLRDGSIDGAELTECGWLVHKHKAKSGYLARSGLHRVLSWPYLFKNYAVRDLAEFLEIYGLPMRLGKYPTGASDQEKMTLLRAVTQIGHNAAGIIPAGMSIDFEEAAKGTADPHLAMIKWAELSTSKAVLGGTLTTQADGKTSTNALGSVHNEVRKELTLSDSKQLESSFNQYLIGAMMRINRPDVDPARYPKFAFDLTEPEDITVYAEALPKLIGAGMTKIKESWAYEKLGIPMAAEGEAVLAIAATPKPETQIAANSRQLPTDPLPQPIDEIPAVIVAVQSQTELDVETDAVLKAERLQPVAANLVDTILDALKETGGFDKALTLLAELSPDQDLQALQDDLEQLGFAAEAFGRLSAIAGRTADETA